MSNEILDNEFHQQGEPDISTVKFATFWTRVGASIIDSLLFLPIIIMGFYNLLDWKMFPLEVMTTFLGIFYKVYMEWKYQATFGKIVMKIRVISEDMRDITLEQSIVRFSFYFMSYIGALLAQYYLFTNPDFEAIQTLEELVPFQQKNQNEILSWASVPIMVSIIMVVLDAKSQAVHDKMARTYCVHR